MRSTLISVVLTLLIAVVLIVVLAYSLLPITHLIGATVSQIAHLLSGSAAR